MEGAQVQSLVRELDPMCCSKDPVCGNDDLAQPNFFFFFNEEDSKGSDVKTCVLMPVA